MDMMNHNLYECKTLNTLDKKVHYNNIFDGWPIEMQYIVKILEEIMIKFELTQAQNPRSSRN